jgi:tellurite resistance protein
LPWILKQPFAGSYWAFSFGVAALALGAERMVDRGVIGPVNDLAPVLFYFANFVIGVLAIGTIILLVRGRLFPAANSGMPAASIPRA